MKVLFLAHRIPYPPTKGEKIRAFHHLQAVAARHEVDLFTLVDRSEDLGHSRSLARYCRNVTVARLRPALARLRALPRLLTRTPLTLPCFYSAELHGKLRRALLRCSYDRIVVSCSAMVQYIEGVEGIPTLVDFMDVDSDKWMQYAGATDFPFSAVYRREGLCLREYERQACRKASWVLVSTDREATLLRQIAPEARVRVLHNGVDTDYFQPAATREETAAPILIFTGDMAYFPNQEAVRFFAQRVLPMVQQEILETRFVIVGREPSRNIKRLGNLPGVEVTGFVPDVRPYLAQARVAVAPFSIAAGIQNKILEAMACGLPIVATTRAVQGLSAPVAEMVATGDSAAELAAQVIALLHSPELAGRRGLEGRRRVSATYRWDSALAELLQLLENPERAEDGRPAALERCPANTELRRQKPDSGAARSTYV